MVIWMPLEPLNLLEPKGKIKRHQQTKKQNSPLRLMLPPPPIHEDIAPQHVQRGLKRLLDRAALQQHLLADGPIERQIFGAVELTKALRRDALQIVLN